MPAEVLAFYVPATAALGAGRTGALWTCLIVGLLATAGYLFLSRPAAGSGVARPAPHFYVLAAVAFLAWAVGTSRATAELFGFDAVIGALLLGAATLLIPMVDGLITQVLSGRRPQPHR